MRPPPGARAATGIRAARLSAVGVSPVEPVRILAGHATKLPPRIANTVVAGARGTSTVRSDDGKVCALSAQSASCDARRDRSRQAQVTTAGRLRGRLPATSTTVGTVALRMHARTRELKNTLVLCAFPIEVARWRARVRIVFGGREGGGPGVRMHARRCPVDEFRAWGVDSRKNRD